jgi:hypothetical protein
MFLSNAPLSRDENGFATGETVHNAFFDRNFREDGT